MLAYSYRCQRRGYSDHFVNVNLTDHMCDVAAGADLGNLKGIKFDIFFTQENATNYYSRCIGQYTA